MDKGPPPRDNRTLVRFKNAKKRRDAWNPLLASAYEMVYPEHDPFGNAVAGQSTRAKIYDDTAVNAVDEKKARLHNSLFPPYREFTDFTLEGLPDEGEGDDSLYNRVIEKGEEARERFHRAIERSNFHIEIDAALGDALISTGAIIMQKGTPDNPIQCEAVPIAELVPEEGKDGTLNTGFRPRQVFARNIEKLWDDADIPASLTDKIKDAPEEKVSVVEAFIYVDEDGTTDYEVWLTDGLGDSESHKLVSRNYKTNPLIMFRIDKAAGEVMGRGPVLKALPAIQTANKVVELTLKNATISVTGIWQADDDGVMNPSTIRLVPGAIIPKAVGSAGLTPLKAPGDFDVSQLVLGDLRQAIRRAIYGPSLPPVDEGGRTAFEIDVRRAEQQAVELPMGLRVLTELKMPLDNRALDILTSIEFAGSDYYIDPFEITVGEGDGAQTKQLQLKSISPMVRLQDQADAAAGHQAFMAGAQGAPDLINGVVDRAGYLAAFLVKAGFPSEHLQTKEKQAEYEAMVRLEMSKLEAQARLEAQAQQNTAQPQGGGGMQGGAG